MSSYEDVQEGIIIDYGNIWFNSIIEILDKRTFHLLLNIFGRDNSMQNS